MKKADMSDLKEVTSAIKNQMKELREDPAPSEEAKVDIAVLNCLRDYLEETLRVAEERDKKMVWVGACLLPEILMAMDVHMYQIELLLGLAIWARPDISKKHNQLGESVGLAPEMCAAVKGVLGGMLSNAMPYPDLFIANSLPCDNLVIGYQIYQNLLPDVPSLFVDAPYGDKEEDLNYYGNEMKRMVTFLEEHTGKKMDYDRLRELVTESNRAHEYWLEICELRKTIPTPHPARLLSLADLVTFLGSGKPEATAVFKRVRDDAKRRVENKIGVIPEEKVRVIWFMLPLYFDLGIFDWMEQELGAVIPMDMVSYMMTEPIDTSTPESMLKGLGRKGLNAPMARQLRGPTSFYTDDLVRVCEDYRGDVVIFSGHEGCKMAWGSIGLIRDTCRELDKPLLVMDVDAIIEKPGQATSIRNKIEEFLNTVVAAA